MRKNSKRVIVGIFLVFTILFFSIANVKTTSAAPESFVCAERTLSGQWCQNVPSSQADTHYNVAQTSCESTSFCRLGTCVDNQEGLCRPNVAESVCQQSNGAFYPVSQDQLQQCQLGCCLLGDQAAFVTQTSCKGLASQYGVNSTFRSDIRDSASCLALSNPQAMGACVIDDGATRDCQMKTKADCNSLKSANSGKSVEFNEGLLCTADALATRCAPTEKTTCVDGKYGVYFLDSCGNVANIYDASKIKDKEYWTDIKSVTESCNPDGSNAGSSSCGNCDYSSGSICKPYQRGSSETPTKAQYGDFVCADLSCKYKGQTYQHGEEWCATDFPGINDTLPGSEYYVLKCYNGEVTSENCDPRRASVCYQGVTTEGYRTAQCLTNLWGDCTAQTNQKDCENVEKRDCQWVVGNTSAGLVGDFQTGTTLVLNSSGDLVPSTESNTGKGAACLPKFAPGQEFWANDTGGATELCYQASENCVVKFTRGNVFSDYKCSENCGCLDPNWAKEKEKMCISLGDCGLSTNYIKVKGDNANSTSIIGKSPKGWDLVGDIKRKLNLGANNAAG